MGGKYKTEWKYRNRPDLHSPGAQGKKGRAWRNCKPEGWCAKGGGMGKASILEKVNWIERARCKEDRAPVTMIFAGLGRGAAEGELTGQVSYSAVVRTNSLLRHRSELFLHSY